MKSQNALELLNSGGEETEIRVALKELSKKPELTLEEIKGIAGCLLSDNLAIKDLATRTILELEVQSKELAAKTLSGYIIGDNVELRNLAGEILTNLGDISAKYLVGYLKSDDPDLRQFACDILANLDSRDYLDDIATLLQDDNENCRVAATIAVGNMEAKEYVSVLRSMYSVSEELKPVIIESLGKIGGREVEEFLIERLDEEDDIFIVTTAIDALAMAGRDSNICSELLEKIDSIPEPVQPYVLKTIYAIATRTDVEVILPGTKRNIAHRAMMDEDEDVRIAGLLALGRSYQVDDIEYLINEIHYRLDITEKIILENLVIGSEESVVGLFFDRFMIKCDDEDKFEFISHLRSIWNVEVAEKSAFVLKKVLGLAFRDDCMISGDVAILVYHLNEELAKEFFEAKLNSDEKARAEEILNSSGLEI